MTGIGAVRAARAEDAEAILELSLLRDLAEIGEPDSSIDEVNADLVNEGFLAAVIEDPRGGLVGYVWAEHTPSSERVWGDVIIRPGADAAVASSLLDWLRARAEASGRYLPVHAFTDSENLLKRRLFEAVGGEVIRRFYRMEVTFDDAPPLPVPALADGVEIRQVSSDSDVHAMYDVTNAAFRDHFGYEEETYERWAQRTVNGMCHDLSLWWLAVLDGEPVAGAYSAVVAPKGYVDTLGTLRAHRGKGLARALLLTSFGEFYARGLRKAALGVDATNPTGAIALYESVGMTAAHEGWRYELPPLTLVSG